MTDKTLGAYTRHEKHDAADFARADSARHPDGRTADRRYPLPGQQWCAWESRPGGSYHALTDAEMAAGGWSPVRECPDPEQHNPAHDIDWQATAEQHEDTMRALIKERDEARATKDMHKRRADEERARADQAEKERDEAREARTVYLPGPPRPLTPDAMSDQFVDYVHEDYFWSTSDRVRLEKPALKHALLDAVKRLAEGRPEWQRVESLLRGMPPGTVTQGSKWLVERGVRVVTEEQP